jgi:ESX secretion system ATPase EccB
MGTNKDQAQAHQFMLQRVISALTVQEADPEQPPFRRPLLAAIGGIAIGILVMAGFWVYGLLVPGGDQFTDADVIAVEEETGARYVLLNGKLHPVINYTSALLALDKHADVRMVSHATLAGIPVGPPIGITGAPDSLPRKDQLLTGGWSMCNQSTVDDQGKSRDTSVLLVGEPPAENASAAGRAMVVQSDGRVYLLYNGFRHEIAAGVDVALNLSKETTVSVDGTWLDTVPAGKPIGPIALATPGQASTAVPGLNLVAGQLLEVEDGAIDGESGTVREQYYLVLADQLQPISQLQASIQQVLGPHANPPVAVDKRALLNAKQQPPRRPQQGDPPLTRPPFVVVGNPDAAICATFQPGNTVPTISVGATLPATALAAPGRPVRIVVPPGKGALVEVMSGPDEHPGQGTFALVTDQGRLYPLADPRHVLQVLGLDGVTPVRITSTLVDRVPRGESLNQEAARTPVGED